MAPQPQTRLARQTGPGTLHSHTHPSDLFLTTGRLRLSQILLGRQQVCAINKAQEGGPTLREKSRGWTSRGREGANRQNEVASPAGVLEAELRRKPTVV